MESSEMIGKHNNPHKQTPKKRTGPEENNDNYVQVCDVTCHFW